MEKVGLGRPAEGSASPDGQPAERVEGARSRGNADPPGGQVVAAGESCEEGARVGGGAARVAVGEGHVERYLEGHSSVLRRAELRPAAHQNRKTTERSPHTSLVTTIGSRASPPAKQTSGSAKGSWSSFRRLARTVRPAA